MQAASRAAWRIECLEPRKVKVSGGPYPDLIRPRVDASRAKPMPLWANPRTAKMHARNGGAPEEHKPEAAGAFSGVGQVIRGAKCSAKIEWLSSMAKSSDPGRKGRGGRLEGVLKRRFIFVKGQQRGGGRREAKGET
ncbi:hypothetical protein KM043_004511 [Ampulex compressa]|nr:hypothetical protein KM043_004511 [Ampulex compressa]